MKILAVRTHEFTWIVHARLALFDFKGTTPFTFYLPTPNHFLCKDVNRPLITVRQLVFDNETLRDTYRWLADVPIVLASH